MIEWLSGNRQTSYPFARPVRWQGARVDGAILDASIGFGKPVGRVGLSFLGDPRGPAPMLTLRAIGGDVVFSGAAVSAGPYGDYRMLVWDGEQGGIRTVGTMVIDPTEAAGVPWPAEPEPTDAEFSAGAVTVPPRMVGSVSFDGNGPYTGDIRMQEGNNVGLSEANGAAAIGAGAGLGSGYPERQPHRLHHDEPGGAGEVPDAEVAAPLAGAVQAMQLPGRPEGHGAGSRPCA